MKCKIFLLIFILFFISCTAKHKVSINNLKIKHFENIPENNFIFEKNWWEYFNDKNLNFLIKEGLKNNLDIKIAIQKIIQAENLITERKSLLYPDISIETSRSKSKQHLHNLPGFIPSVIETRLYSGNIFASYELDFWGKYRNLSENAKHIYFIQEYGLDIVKKSIATNVAISYFKMIISKLQTKILQNIINLLQQEKDIIKRRYEHGLVSINTLYEINSNIKETKSLLPIIKSTIATTKYKINFILNKKPSNNIKIAIKLPDIYKLKIPANLPSDVLKRRTDVKIAMEKILAEKNLLKTAKANIFPSFTLTGKYGFENEDLTNLIRNSSSLYSWISRIFVNIFDYGAKKAKIKKEESKLKELKLEYCKTITTVFKNVESSLVNFKKLKEKYFLLDGKLKDLKKIYLIKKRDYENGISDITDVIISKINFLNLEYKILNIKFQIIAGYIKALKELGY